MAVFARIKGKLTDLRRFLASECIEDWSCRALHGKFTSTSFEMLHNKDLSEIQQTYAVTEFCLQPEGDTPTRQSWFDAIINLCIPVFFSDCLESELLFEREYEHFLPAFERTAFGPGHWAVLLNVSAVLARPGYIAEQLRRVSTEERLRMRAVLASSVPKLLYARPTARGGAWPVRTSAPAQLLKRISKPRL